jgi:hypothetical protein
LQFARSVEIAVPFARVWEELSEPARFLGLQPLLVEVREVAAPGGARAFEAVEVVRALGVPLRSRLRVELRPEVAAQRVAFATRAPLGIALTGEFALEALGAERTAVRESVTLRCSRLLRPFVVAQATRAQEALLANLKQRLETRKG